MSSGPLYTEGKTASVSVGTTAIELNAGLRRIAGTTLYNNSANTIYFGFYDDVTVDDGFPLLAGEKVSIDGDVRFFGIAESADNDVRVMEVA